MLLLFLLSTTAFYAQSEVEKWNKKTNETNEQVLELDTTLQDTRETLNNLGKTLGGIFKNKNTVIIAISGIRFGDEKLTEIQENFRRVKGVKNVAKHLDNGTVSIQMKTKKGPSQVWEELPRELRSNFIVIEADEKTMLMQYRKKTAEQIGSAIERENGRNR